MIEGIKALFGNATDVAELKKANKELAQDKNRLEKTVEERDKRIGALIRKYDDELFEAQRVETKRRKYHEDEVEDLERRLSREASRADEAEALADRTREAELIAEDLVNDNARLIESHRKELDSVKKQALIDARAEMQASTDETNNVIAIETARAEAAVASALEKDAVIQSLQNQLGNAVDLVKFAMTKLPEVDLGKFNVNIEVPPADVTVVSGNGGGGKKQK